MCIVPILCQRQDRSPGTGGIEYLPSGHCLQKVAADRHRSADQKGQGAAAHVPVDIELTDNSDAAFFGERVYVRFTHEMNRSGCSGIEVSVCCSVHFNI